ncbi:MAG TPA: hypothetical protein VKB86_20765 [Pyrinomonadaceae bacterium]|nr:hypothetical protein [Pyrinomonadaceae bacterium]
MKVHFMRRRRNKRVARRVTSGLLPKMVALWRSARICRTFSAGFLLLIVPDASRLATFYTPLARLKEFSNSH